MTEPPTERLLVPINNPCKLLNRLVQERNESEWLEFKKCNFDPEMIGQNVSALANAAMLADRDRAFLVFGVENKTRNKLGTEARLNEIKKGGENLANWLSRMIEPKLMLELLDFECEGKNFSILAIEPTYDRPVRFSGTEYVRIGENTKKLADFPNHERALWLATGRRKFEDAVAAPSQDSNQVLEKLEVDAFYNLSDQPKPQNETEIIRRFLASGFIIDDMEGGYNVTNLGAILFARDLALFPSVAGKSVRIIKYAGPDKSRSEFEQEGKKGYAVGFSGMIRFILQRIQTEELYIDGVRKVMPLFPETAIREVIANALIHQDFTIGGSGPVIEIYSNRVEVTNPGNSLIDTDRMLDERRSRNEKLASAMRELGLCEER